MVRCSTSVIDIRNRNIRQEEGVRYIKDLECEKAALQTDSTLHCKGKRKLKKIAYVNLLQMISKKSPNFYVC